MTEKVVLITGTSRGIGKAIAAYLRAQGLTVYGSSRGVADVGPYHLQIDITDYVSCQSAVDEVDVNFFGAVHMMKAATPGLLKQRSGSTLNISSIGSDAGWTFNAAYSAGKFALHGYSEAIRRELLPFNIFVSLVLTSRHDVGHDPSFGATICPKVSTV